MRFLTGTRVAEASQFAQRALGVARANGQRADEAYALRLLGETAALRDPPATGEAETRLREALLLAEQLGMRPLRAHCRMSLGKLYRRAGRPDEARAELNQAVDLYLSMEMGYWLPEAEAELAALGPVDIPHQALSQREREPIAPSPVRRGVGAVGNVVCFRRGRAARPRG